MALTINSISFNPLPGAFSGATATSGNYYDTGSFGGSPNAFAPVYEEQDITFPGIDGTITKRFGFRYRLITAPLIIVGAYPGIGGTRNSILESFAQQNRYPISMDDGSSYEGCKLVSCTSLTFKNASGKSLLIMFCTFRQLQLNGSGS